MTLLSAQNVSYQVGSKIILSDVSLTVKAGEAVAVVGPNGAGKSTLLRTLSGELRPTRGVVSLRDRDIAAYGPRELAQHRAVLSQAISVAFPFTLEEIVQMGAGDARTSRVTELVRESIAQVDLTKALGRIFTTLSGGEQQRAHFARILVQIACGEAKHGPGAVLLDEPTASLDLKHQLALARLARTFVARGFGLLAIVHDINLATVMADRIVVLHEGRIVADGSVRDVITDTLLAEVFGVEGALNKAPRAMPFVLPQNATLR